MTPDGRCCGGEARAGDGYLIINKTKGWQVIEGTVGLNALPRFHLSEGGRRIPHARLGRLWGLGRFVIDSLCAWAVRYRCVLDV